MIYFALWDLFTENTHLHPTAFFLVVVTQSPNLVLVFSRALSSYCIATFHFGSSLATYQKMGKVTESKDAINAPCVCDVLE